MALIFSYSTNLLVISIEEHNSTYLLVYSLATHEVVKKLDFSGASVISFQATPAFIVVVSVPTCRLLYANDYQSTTYPSSLHILNSRSLDILHTIEDRKLVKFSRPMTPPAQQSNAPSEPVYFARQDHPHAVYALSSRLLAYASRPLTPARSSTRSSSIPHTATPQSPSINFGSINVTQADIGNAALKVGGGFLSGMKALGGFAAAAARGESISSAVSDTSAGFRSFFSRTTPAAPQRHERRHSEYPDIRGTRSRQEGDVSTQASPVAMHDRDVHVTILDLQPLLDTNVNARPERLMDFILPAGYSVAGLQFSADGTSLAVVPSDGNIVRVYNIRPKPRAVRVPLIDTSGSLSSLRSSSSDILSFQSPTSPSAKSDTSFSSVTEGDTNGEPWHVYDLRRGRTSGVIEEVRYSVDHRWMAFATRMRTIHVFATNPYWGRPDDASHLDGRVRNVATLVGTLRCCCCLSILMVFYKS